MLTCPDKVDKILTECIGIRIFGVSICYFVDNQVRLQLFALAYNLGNFLRRVALPRSICHWSMTTLRNKLVKIGAKVISHARYTVFQMAEVAVPKEIFEAVLERIERFRSLSLESL